MAALCDGSSVTKACEAAGIPRQNVYEWRNADEDFKIAWEEALEAGADVLEDEAKRRAVDGWEEPVHYQGKPTGSVRKYSDTLLMFLLKGRRPEKFKDRLEHTGKDGGPIDIVARLNEGIERVRNRDKAD